MNANELADEIDKWTLMVNPKKVSKVIRQQQAEIEALKERKISLSYADLEARLDWSRHEGSGASYLEGFEDGALWAEQEMRKAQEK